MTVNVFLKYQNRNFQCIKLKITLGSIKYNPSNLSCACSWYLTIKEGSGPTNLVVPRQIAQQAPPIQSCPLRVCSPKRVLVGCASHRTSKTTQGAQAAFNTHSMEPSIRQLCLKPCQFMACCHPGLKYTFEVECVCFEVELPVHLTPG